METYQICASKGGWRNCKNTTLLEFRDKQKAISYLQVLADNLNSEVRGAWVTGYENLVRRNREGEKLGNGIYITPSRQHPQ